MIFGSLLIGKVPGIQWCDFHMDTTKNKTLDFWKNRPSDPRHTCASKPANKEI